MNGLCSISYMGCHPNPIDELIFFKMVKTTNQVFVWVGFDPFSYLIFAHLLVFLSGWVAQKTSLECLASSHFDIRACQAEIAERWITFQVERGFTKDPSSFNAVTWPGRGATAARNGGNHGYFDTVT